MKYKQAKIANWVVGVAHACTLILAMLQLVASRRVIKMFAPCQKRRYKEYEKLFDN